MVEKDLTILREEKLLELGLKFNSENISYDKTTMYFDIVDFNLYSKYINDIGTELLYESENGNSYIIVESPKRKKFEVECKNMMYKTHEFGDVSFYKGAFYEVTFYDGVDLYLKCEDGDSVHITSHNRRKFKLKPLFDDFNNK